MLTIAWADKLSRVGDYSPSASWGRFILTGTLLRLSCWHLFSSILKGSILICTYRWDRALHFEIVFFCSIDICCTDIGWILDTPMELLLDLSMLLASDWSAASTQIRVLGYLLAIHLLETMLSSVPIMWQWSLGLFNRWSHIRAETSTLSLSRYWAYTAWTLYGTVIIRLEEFLGYTIGLFQWCWLLSLGVNRLHLSLRGSLAHHKLLLLRSGVLRSNYCLPTYHRPKPS